MSKETDILVITGASGFIGRCLAAHAHANGAQVIAVSRSKARYDEGIEAFTVADYHDTPAPKGAALIHLAGTRDIGRAERAGPEGVTEARSLAEALANKPFGQRVLASSALVYGDRDARPHDPDTPAANPNGYYAMGKRAAEDAFLAAGGAVARLANVYGPGMATTNVLADILSQIPGTLPLMLRDGSAIRDFLWVEDAAAGLFTLAARGHRGIFNLGSGQAISVSDLVGLALSETGQSDRPVKSEPRLTAPSCCTVDIEKTVRETGWQPTITLDQGLARLLEDAA